MLLILSLTCATLQLPLTLARFSDSDAAGGDAVSAVMRGRPGVTAALPACSDLGILGGWAGEFRPGWWGSRSPPQAACRWWPPASYRAHQQVRRPRLRYPSVPRVRRGFHGGGAD